MSLECRVSTSKVDTRHSTWPYPDSVRQGFDPAMLVPVKSARRLILRLMDEFFT
ncbi:hypothetical protein DPMN_063366 [Dreissena polymorpha]|uniref:Uncharacterized protein n=1 Tax=Dreissena polymorpha TaxID=45954 RepID=A0A9D4HJ13_DREPO|nr:hypothetical protein DPMN_063366 [Dreissena polymorpha]